MIQYMEKKQLKILIPTVMILTLKTEQVSKETVNFCTVPLTVFVHVKRQREIQYKR